MSPYDFPGLVSGIAASQLVLWGSVVLLLAGLRALLVRGQPGRGRWARGLLVGALLPIAAGVVLLALQELTDHQRLLDRAGVPVLATGAILGAAWVTVRRARPRSAAPHATTEGAPPAPPA
ncbi:MAG: hypothetical protein QM704_02950 [Anaeromyxobacteraceae bacterium]